MIIKTKEIKITPPEGYEIDKENSTFDCIKFKPVAKRWREGNWVVSGYCNWSAYPNAQSVEDTGEWMEIFNKS